jgi:hypothetical protein
MRPVDTKAVSLTRVTNILYNMETTLKQKGMVEAAEIVSNYSAMIKRLPDVGE